MAIIHKLEFYIVDANEEYVSIEEIINNIERHMDTTLTVINKKTSKSFEWDDDLKINKTNAIEDDYEKYFK